MVTRLRPLDVKLIYEGRRYTMGERLDLTIEVKSRMDSDLDIREGRVALRYEVRFKAPYDGSPRASTMASYRVSPLILGDRTRKETYLSDSTVFLTNGTLGPGNQMSYPVRLDIKRDKSLLRSDITVTWKLAVKFDVAQARDVSVERTILVTN